MIGIFFSFFLFLEASKLIGYRLEMLFNLLIEPDQEVDICLLIDMK